MKSEEFLESCNSACSAALDFQFFTKECFKTCQYNDNQKESEVDYT
jgi:hypothetical protein